jgi:hypothetical protein
MTKHLQDLLEAAKKFVFTSEDKEQQRRSFAYGNTVIENPRITREMIDRAAEALNQSESLRSGLY